MSRMLDFRTTGSDLGSFKPSCCHRHKSVVVYRLNLSHGIGDDD